MHGILAGSAMLQNIYNTTRGIQHGARQATQNVAGTVRLRRAAGRYSLVSCAALAMWMFV